MRFALIYLLAVVLPAVPAFAQRGGGGGQGGEGGRGGRPGRPNGNPPNTLVTVARPPPAATAAPAPAPAAGGNGGNTGGGNAGAVSAALIPPFGVTAGVKSSDGTANCVGINNINIPCDCPPSLNTFVGAVSDSVARGAAFPTGNSVADQLTRLQTCIVTLQNFKGGPGSGVGCPAVSTTWKALQAQLQGQA
ncbi:hypothetical protein LTR84_007261 [Exophiala bonariae]|uniref:Hydrophobin n=1 Tax=Exophiala bonariae TaxID=1690606 RepID=A0AAV9MZK3_9EURO|nr:hypothetical protein LTR84_007261 [Exophiala bonariae]